MAEDIKQDPKQELSDLAFDIYARRMASGQTKRNAETEAVDSFKQAEAFLKVRASVAKGETKLKAPEGPQLADCCCPKQAKTHPHNLVSQQFGSIDRVQKINAWLKQNPTPEKEPDELVMRLNREFSDLSWDLAAVNTARTIFPAFCKS